MVIDKQRKFGWVHLLVYKYTVSILQKSLLNGYCHMS